jgi:sarcosine oxidase subunit alpha
LITITINNKEIRVEQGTTVAAALLANGIKVFRRSVEGTPRGPLCGMGICFECSLTIDGVGHQRSCTLLAVDGMTVDTDE